jgi:gliding motility-associated-like protein
MSLLFQPLFLYICESMTFKGLYIVLIAMTLSLVSFDLAGQNQISPNAGVSAITCPFYIPNAFTPNGDNINERFVVAEGENCRVVEFNIRIFDRWGRLVFESSSPAREDSWDGTFEGENLAKGVYIYNVSAKLESANFSSEPQQVNRQGTVVLIR